ncbi:KUP/HAK/KT family potassium transporter [Rhizobium ruizarguesonis]
MTDTKLRSADPELEHQTRQGLPSLVLAALGVVYGDIGTSPLYAFREALHATGGSGAHHANVLGILSLIVWALTIVVTLKYVTFVLKADNRGEGGTLSLMTLAREGLTGRPKWVLVLGVIGASLFLGDAIITPAISVLSAVEGIEVVAPGLSNWVVPITLTIIAVLFFVQRFGTSGVASIFGPVTALWFVVLGVSGAIHIFDDPSVLGAVNPVHALRYIASNIDSAIAVLGAVFLAVTGAEALYVDLGHFGRRPIVVAWFSLVFPSLLLNYFGQGAFVLANPEMAEHPFFSMHPEWARVPMVCLATAATIIASQAVISTAMFLTSDIEGAPTALLHSLKHYKVLHERNVILSVVTSTTPFVPDDEKIFLESFNPQFSRLVITFGYMETPNIPRALVLARKLGLKFDIMSTSFFLSRRTILPSKKGGLPFWQDRLFISLAQNASNATDYFGLPSGRVVELGLQTTV